MSVQIIQDLIPAGRRNRPGHKLTPKYITVHDTANPDAGANSKAHAGYLKGAAAAAIPASWHFTVDDKEIYQHLPLDENGWHAGDGTNGPGNRQSIGIEICENKDGSRVQAEKNAAWLTAKLLRDHGLEIAAVKQHFNWSGKDCPHILRARPGGWAGFLSAVEAYLKTAVSPVPSADRFMVVSFDDFNASDYLLAYPTLKSLGVRGTSYAHTGPITAEGWARAREMVAAGWDIQCHTVTHPDLRMLSDSDIRAELEEVNRIFAANGLPVPCHHAYPSGLYDSRVKAIVQEYRKSARTVRADTFDGIDRSTLNFYELHPIGGDMQIEDDFQYLRGRLDQAYERNRIVITIHHRVHAAADPDPPVLSTRQDLLKRTVEYALQKGFKIVTISQLYALLTGEASVQEPVVPVVPTGPLPKIAKRIGIEVNDKMSTESGYLIDNATYVRAAYIVPMVGGTVTGHGDHIKVKIK